MSRNEFLYLQSKVDQILDVVTSVALKTTEESTSQSLVDKVQTLETIEKFTTD